MSNYTPPTDDIRFVMTHVADIEGILATERFGHVDMESIGAVVDEVGRFMAEEVAPTNVDGDRIGSQWQADGTVVTPESFTPAYEKWVASGFGAMPFEAEYGGADFPWISAIAVQEMFTSSNMSLSLCPLLTQGAIDAILAHGSDEQKATYLPKMMTGEWTGTMNLTEPQAGSDVGAVATKAEPNGDGSWSITGQKIFITYRRARSRRADPPPRARAYARVSTRHEGHLDVPGPEVRCSKTTVRSASGTRRRVSRSSTSSGSTVRRRASWRSTVPPVGSSATSTTACATCSR